MSLFMAPSDIESLITTTVPTGLRLFTMQDLYKLFEEIEAPELSSSTSSSSTNNNKHEYKLLKNDEQVGYKLWVKSQGEGSGKFTQPLTQYDCPKSATSHFLRHKYTCQLPMSTQLFYDVSRDYAKRLEWDKRDGGRRIVQIVQASFSPVVSQDGRYEQLPHQVIEQMIKKVGSVMSDRECITLTAEYMDRETGTIYWLSKSIPDDLANQLIQSPITSPAVIHSATGPVKSSNNNNGTAATASLNNQGLVRSDVLYLGMVLKPLAPNRMEYWCVTQLDPKGWLPANIMNWATQFIPKAFKREIIEASEMRSERDPSSLTYVNYYKPLSPASPTVTTIVSTDSVKPAVEKEVEAEAEKSTQDNVQQVEEEQQQQPVVEQVVNNDVHVVEEQQKAQEEQQQEEEKEQEQADNARVEQAQQQEE